MRLLFEEALANEPMDISTKIALTGGEYDHYDLKYPIEDYCVITIIRAGDSMLDNAFELLPGVSVGKVLIQRDESTAEKKPVYYYDKLPKQIMNKKRVYILDPMLGTGGSVGTAIDLLLTKGVKESSITFLNLISCPEGLKAVTTKYKDVKIITAILDPKMNDNMYIDPGLGDFGDRYFNSN